MTVKKRAKVIKMRASYRGFKIDPQDFRRKQYTYRYLNIVKHRPMILQNIDIQLAQQISIL